MLTYDANRKLYVWRGPDDHKALAHFSWSPAGECYYTHDIHVAYPLSEWAQGKAKAKLKALKKKIEAKPRMVKIRYRGSASDSALNAALAVYGEHVGFIALPENYS